MQEKLTPGYKSTTYGSALSTNSEEIQESSAIERMKNKLKSAKADNDQFNCDNPYSFNKIAMYIFIIIVLLGSLTVALQLTGAKDDVDISIDDNFNNNDVVDIIVGTDDTSYILSTDDTASQNITVVSGDDSIDDNTDDGKKPSCIL